MRETSRLRVEGSFHGGQMRVKSKRFVFKHVLANCFTSTRIWPEAERSLRRLPGFCVGNRVVDSDVEQHGVVVNAPETLDEVQLVAVRMAHPIEPIYVADIDGIDDKCIAIPHADRVPHPQGAEAWRMLTPIRIDLAHIASKE